MAKATTAKKAKATTAKSSGEITVFLRDGGTLMFYGCELINDYGDHDNGFDGCELVFTYKSASTGKKKRALFCTSVVAGYSYEVE